MRCGSMHRATIVLGAVACIVALAQAADPVIYYGPHENRLEVTPPQTFQGKARYALWQGERCVWSTTSEVLAQDLVLMPDLSAVGYSYSSGTEYRPRGGTLDIMWVSPKGETEILKRFPRQSNPFIHACPPDPAEPTGTGVLAAGSDTAVIRLYEPMREATPYRWVVVNSRTRELSVVTPDHPPLLARGVGADGLPTGGTVIEVAAQYVEDANAILVHWLLFESADGYQIKSAYFALIDLSGSTIWEHECHDDCRDFPRRLTWLDYFKENPQVTVDGSLITVHAIRANVTRYFRIKRVPDSDRVTVDPLNELPGHDLQDLPRKRP